MFWWCSFIICFYSVPFSPSFISFHSYFVWILISSFSDAQINEFLLSWDFSSTFTSDSFSLQSSVSCFRWHLKNTVDRILRFLDSVTFPTFTWTFSLLSPHCPKPVQSIIPFTAVCSHVEQVSSMLSLGLGCPSPVGSFHGLLFHSPLSESLSVSTLLLSEPPFFFIGLHFCLFIMLGQSHIKYSEQNYKHSMYFTLA